MTPPTTLLYRKLRSLIEYNRHLIAGYRLRSSQHTEARWQSQLVFIGIALIVGAYVAYAFGDTLAQVWPLLDDAEAGWHMLLMVGSGWIFLGTISAFTLTYWIEYWGHLATIMLAGTLMFFPWQLMHWIHSVPLPYTLGVGASVSFVSMALLHHSRVNLLEIPKYWSIIWILAIATSFIGWGLFFYY